MSSTNNCVMKNFEDYVTTNYAARIVNRTIIRIMTSLQISVDAIHASAIRVIAHQNLQINVNAIHASVIRAIAHQNLQISVSAIHASVIHAIVRQSHLIRILRIVVPNAHVIHAVACRAKKLPKTLVAVKAVIKVAKRVASVRVTRVTGVTRVIRVTRVAHALVKKQTILTNRLKKLGYNWTNCRNVGLTTTTNQMMTAKNPMNQIHLVRLTILAATSATIKSMPILSILPIAKN